jgi:small nuclear ribonucleoprotein (snRNP)-like protein
MNIVVDDTVETTKDGDRQIGMVVIRGNSIVIMEPRERIA